MMLDNSAQHIVPLVDFSFRWQQLADWLTELKTDCAVCSFLCDQFMNLLKLRGLSMENVSWELIPGIRSFQALIAMLNEALAATNVSIHQFSAGRYWHGFYIEQKKFFIGIYYENPNLLVMNSEVDLAQNLPKQIGTGAITNGRWENALDLTSERTHFFARSKVSQLQCLEEFIKTSLNFGRTIIS